MKNRNVAQRTPEWHFLRKGKITGTVLKNLMGTPKARKEQVYELIAERLSVGIDEGEENAMDRGTRLEPQAIAMFELETGKRVKTVGFLQDDTHEAIAQSPDGIIEDTNDEEALEVKCPGGKNYVKLWFENKIPDEYHWQVVQYFVVNQNLKKLYFMGYNPDIPVHKLHIMETTREELAGDITQARTTQEEVIKEVNESLKAIVKEI